MVIMGLFAGMLLSACGSPNSLPNTTASPTSSYTAPPGSSAGAGIATVPVGSTANLIPTVAPSIVKSFQLQNKATSGSVCGTPTPTGVDVGSFQVTDIFTDNLLQVTLTGQPPQTLPCTSTTPQYSCETFTVTVGTLSKLVTVSYGNPTIGACAGVPNSQTVDFSSQTVHGVNQTYSVKISNPQIDNCRLFYGSASIHGTILSSGSSIWIPAGAGYHYGGCIMDTAYDNYIVSATVGISVNSP